MNASQTGSMEAALFSSAQRSTVRPGAVRAAGSGGTEAARKAAQQLVGETFFGQLIKELRKSTREDHLLFGGHGEATLRPQLDQMMARQLAASRRFDLADAVFEYIYRDTPYSPVRSAGSVSADSGEETL